MSRHDMPRASFVEPPLAPCGVSAIVPAFNYARYLPDVLDSILGQNVTDLEVIVVDDASTDGTAEVVAGYGDRVRSLRQPSRLGCGAALNRGVAASTKPFLAFADADDVWPPARLVHQLAAFARDPSVDLVFGHAQEFWSAELNDEERTKVVPRSTPATLAGTLMVRRGTCGRIGGFGEGLTVGEFMDWYARAVDAGLRAVMLPEVVLLRRLHAANLGRRERDARPDYLRVIKRALERRRALGLVAPPPGASVP